MTLPASGPIDLNQIANEFGLANTTAFPTGFYGKGGAASSGPLSFADFYGRSGTTFNPNGGAVTDDKPYTATVTLTCTTAATWTYGTPTGSGGTASVNVTSGGSSTSITFTLNSGGFPPYRTSGSQTWAVTGISGSVTKNFTVNLMVDGDGE